MRIRTRSILIMTFRGLTQATQLIIGKALRENTERPVTITEGTNRLIHIDTDDILNHYNEI